VSLLRPSASTSLLILYTTYAPVLFRFGPVTSDPSSEDFSLASVLSQHIGHRLQIPPQMERTETANTDCRSSSAMKSRHDLRHKKSTQKSSPVGGCAACWHRRAAQRVSLPVKIQLELGPRIALCPQRQKQT